MIISILLRFLMITVIIGNCNPIFTLSCFVLFFFFLHFIDQKKQSTSYQKNDSFKIISLKSSVCKLIFKTVIKIMPKIFILHYNLFQFSSEFFNLYVNYFLILRLTSRFGCCIYESCIIFNV